MNNPRSHAIRSIIFFDERGKPKYNVKLEKDKHVQILFDILSQHESIPPGNESSSTSENVHIDGHNIKKRDLMCGFWNHTEFQWSSDGCSTLFQDDKIVGNIHPKGILYF